MAKEESKKEKKSKSKAAAKVGSAAAAPDARAVVVASVAAFLEAGGFPRALSALQSEASLEDGAWRSTAVSLEDLVSKFLESSGVAPATVTVGSNEQDKATDTAVEDAGKKKKGNDTELNEAETNASVPSAIQEDETGEKKKKKQQKGDTEASEPETKVIEPSADKKPAENAGAETQEKKHKKKKDSSSAEEAKETVKSDDQKVDGKKKKSKKQEKEEDVEARLEKASLTIEKKLKEDGSKSKEEALKIQNNDADKNVVGDGAADKSKKKKKGKSAVEKSEKIDAVSVAVEADGMETVKDNDEKKAKKKRKKSDSEENVLEEGKEIAGKGSVPESDVDNNAVEIEDGENGRPSSENAVVGKKRKLEEVEESKPPATENGTGDQTLCNGFAEDDSKENSNMSKPSKRQKKSAEPKSVTPFQRVKLEAVKFADERLQDNSYWAKGGAEIGYGAKAQEILGQVRGRGFRHEKTKKKRGTYRGGQIDLGTHSIKFDNSDDE